MTIARAEAAPKEGVEPGYRWVILGVALVAQIGATVPAQAVAVFGPFMQIDLGLSRAELGLFQTALALGQVALVVVAGLATDRVGIRRMLFAGLVVIGSFIVVAGWGGSYAVALIAFTLVGLGAAMVQPATVKAVMDWFLPQMRATAMSVKQTGAPLAGMVAAVALPSLAVAFGWKAGVVGVGLCVIVIGIISFFLYRERGDVNASKRATGNSGFGALLRLSRQREVLIIGFVATFGAAAQFALVTFVILFLKEDLLYSVVLGGVILSLIQFGGLAGRILWGLASDYMFRGNRRATLLTMFLLSVLVMVGFAALPKTAPFWLVAALAIAAGLSVISWNGVWMAQATELVDREFVGSVSGIAIMLGTLGVMTGAPIFGTVVDNTASYRVAWLLLAAFCAAGLLLLLALRPPRNAEPVGSH